MEIQKFKVQKLREIKILEIQIRSAQNVGKVWISRKKSSWTHLGQFQFVFFLWTKKKKSACFPLVGRWALFTRYGPLLRFHAGLHGLCWFRLHAPWSAGKTSADQRSLEVVTPSSHQKPTSHPHPQTG